MESVSGYIEKHKERFLEELFGLIRIPSVSAGKDNRDAMIAAAGYIKETLLTSGADRAEVFPTEGWPVIYGEKTIDPALPTVLVYGHYDVQPPDPVDEWRSEPFEPEIRDEKIFARGADDDKGQLFMQLKAFEYMVKESRLPCNVKFLIEGEEETGSSALGGFCLKNRKLLEADVILVSDTTTHSLEDPTLTTGLRGIAYFELTATGPDRDLHSGLYGGIINNPCNVLGEVISGLKDREGRITIPGFYRSVRAVERKERELLNRVPIDENRLKAGIAISGFGKEKGYSVIDCLGSRPSLDVCGIWGGYTGEGAKTIIPSKATAKISMRLVPGQTPEEIETLFSEHIRKQKIAGITFNINVLHGGNPYSIPWESPEVQSAVLAMEKVLGVKPLPVRSGGSIPVISVFEEVLGIKTVLLGFGLEADAIHSPNENFPLRNFFKGIETIPWFYHYYASYKKQG
ncbi:MAG: dipeptidase [Bacteroidales bacterium]|jgi:acetylornithine deacetylase/succinyl-diaminopimelate desuccinylase-like protein